MTKPNTAQAPRVEAAKARRVVTVACKHPSGIVMQLQRPQQITEQTMAGSREVTQYFREGQAYIVKGPAYPVMPPDGHPEKPRIVGGYALTPNIPADFWEEWAKQNRAAPYLMNEMIHAADDDSIVAWCRERAGLRSGLEGLDVKSKTKVGENEVFADPRMPRAATNAIGDIEKATAGAT